MQVRTLELVRAAFHERDEVRETEIAGSGGEGVVEHQRTQGGVPTGRAAPDQQPITVCRTLLREVPRRVDAIRGVEDPPRSVERLPVCPAVAGAAAVVDVDHGEPAAGPGPGTEAARPGRRGRGPAVAG